ncbi:MAG: FecR domain-containing protein [Paenibacillaceae bacterium]|nr:FecR domain-containing protein [Paenibacillaceae bacterium]
MKFIRITLLLLLAVTMLTPEAAVAKDTKKFGKILDVTGSAVVKKGGEKKFKAVKNMAVTEGDVLITGEEAHIELELDSDKLVYVGPDTKLVIHELVKSAKAMEGKTSLSLQKGSVLIKVKKKLTEDSRFEIKTPTTVMGVMGTEFIVGYAQAQTYVGVLEGRVAVRRATAAEATADVMVRPGEQLWRTADGTGTVEALDWGDLPLFVLEQHYEDLNSAGGALPEVMDLLQRVIEQKTEEELSSRQNGTTAASPVIRFEEEGGISSPGSLPSGNSGGGSSGGQDPAPTYPTIISVPEFEQDPEQRTDASIVLKLYGDRIIRVMRTDTETDLVEGVDYVVAAGANPDQTVLVIQTSYMQGVESGIESLGLKLFFASGFHLPMIELHARVPQPPELDMELIEKEPYSLVWDLSTISVPFTTAIEFNTGGGVPDPIESAITLTNVAAYDPDNPHPKVVSGLSIEGNRLIIKLDGSLEFKSEITFYIQEGLLRNPNTGDLQSLIELSSEVKPHADREQVTYSKSEPGDLVWLVNGLGDAFGPDDDYDTVLSDPTGADPQSLMSLQDFNWEIDGSQLWFTLRQAFLNTLDPGEYILQIPFEYLDVLDHAVIMITVEN